MKKHFYTFPDNGDIHYHGLVEVDDKGYINGETPVEDYGDYLLMNSHITNEQARGIFEMIIQSDRIENAK